MDLLERGAELAALESLLERAVSAEGHLVLLGGEAGVGKTALLAGQWATACRLFSATESLRDTIGAPIPPIERAKHDRDVAAVRAAFDDGAFESAWAVGQTLTLEQVVAEAQALADELAGDHARSNVAAHAP